MERLLTWLLPLALLFAGLLATPLWPDESKLAVIYYPLLYFPRWLLLLPLLFALLLTVFCSWRLRMAYSALTLSTQLLYAGYQFPSLTGQPSGRSLTLLTLNTGHNLLDRQRFQALLAESAPDVIFLQESGRQQAAKLFAADWQLGCAGSLCIASRFPLQQQASYPRATGSGSPFAIHWQAELANGKQLELVNVHMDTPRYALQQWLDGRPDPAYFADSYRRRASQARQIAELLSQHSRMVAAGDFNLLAESPIYRSQLAGLKNAFSVRGLGLGGTKFTRYHSARIDHILISANLEVNSVAVANSVGSDHHPLIAEIWL